MDQSTCSSRNTNTSKHPKRNTERGPRHFWTPTPKEAELTKALKSLRLCGWKCDESFKGGYMVRLEKIMAEKFSSCGILSKYIKSKLQVWKKDYSHNLGILGSSGSVGASIDTHMTVVDLESIWSYYIKVHFGTAKLQGRPFPRYHSWVKFFGNDRSQGTGAINGSDTVTDLLYSSQVRDTETSANNLFSPPYCTPFQSLEIAYGDDVSTTHSDDDFELRKELYVVLTEIPGLLIEEMVLATHHLAENDKYTDTFWRMDLDARACYVRILLRGCSN
ncbi:hypothetical protein CDL12_06722 [Handroanthus impetiginosus]|uniref:Myb/SANT-like domain-containing protein n=1 Tax=Handroanthus impetiginosus TaxID=429701 RepID=A0A2G9HST2_9LAMI|nr:hypothetical protein CDL12_06722 [Handroanthus impetiginosus]